MAMAAKRLQKEAVALPKTPPANIRAKPLESDMLIFHYVIEGSSDTPYEGGFYHGVLRFPPEYPLKPPAVLMFTPSGRFQPHARICLSMSDYHPETWNPVWSVSTILVGLQSFMAENTDSVGTVKTSEDVRRKYADQSLDTNLQNKDFCRLFPELVELAAQRREAAAAKAAAKAASARAVAAGASGAAVLSAGVGPLPPAGAAGGGRTGGGGGGGAARAGGVDWAQPLALVALAVAALAAWARSGFAGPGGGGAS